MLIKGRLMKDKWNQDVPQTALGLVILICPLKREINEYTNIHIFYISTLALSSGGKIRPIAETEG